jgi:hypothetical protein
MADYPSVTKEEVEKLYQFIVLKKVLLRTYPWIKDITLPKQEQINKYSLIFYDIHIDPWLAAKERGWKVHWYVNPLRSYEMFPYLASLFVETAEPRDIVKDIESLTEKIHMSPAIPSDFKLPGRRKFQPSSFIISPNTEELPEYTEPYPHKPTKL